MKLLDWVHRKFRREAAPGDPHRDLDDGGQPCTRSSSQPLLKELHPHCQQDQHHATPLMLPPLHQLSLEDDYCHLQPREGEELLLQGLLAIGTLGLGPSLEGLPPPQLLRLFDSIPIAEMERQGATEDSMKAATEAEMEAAPAAPEPRDKDGELSSSSRKASHASFSLGKLFTKSQKVEEGGSGGGGGGGRMKGEKGERTTAGGMVKKVLMRRGSKAGGAASGGASAAPPLGRLPGGTSTAESSKFYKILKMFHKKVHPEGSIARKKHKSPSSDAHVGAVYSDSDGSGSEAFGFSTRASREEGSSCRFRYQTHPPELQECSSSCGGPGGNSNGSREHWIKTDMDYLVLEF